MFLGFLRVFLGQFSVFFFFSGVFEDDIGVAFP